MLLYNDYIYTLLDYNSLLPVANQKKKKRAPVGKDIHAVIQAKKVQKRRVDF